MTSFMVWLGGHVKTVSLSFMTSCTVDSGFLVGAPLLR